MAVTATQVRDYLGNLPIAIITDALIDQNIAIATAEVDALKSSSATDANVDYAIILRAAEYTYVTWMTHKQKAKGEFPAFMEGHYDRIKRLADKFIDRIINPDDVEGKVAPMLAFKGSVGVTVKRDDYYNDTKTEQGDTF